MKVFCWNCQGLGTPLTVRALGANIARDRPNVVFLMETKNQEQVVQRMKKRLKFSFCFVVNPIGIAGGLAVLWNDQVELEIEFASKEMINVICTDPENRIRMRISFVHAPNDFKVRLLLWDRLREVSRLDSLPWVCMGDFNEVLYHWEKNRTTSDRPQPFGCILGLFKRLFFDGSRM